MNFLSPARRSACAVRDPRLCEALLDVLDRWVPHSAAAFRQYRLGGAALSAGGAFRHTPPAGRRGRDPGGKRPRQARMGRADGGAGALATRAAWSPGAGRFGHFRRGRGVAGQADAHGRAVAGLAVDAERAAMQLDRLLASGRPSPVPSCWRLSEPSTWRNGTSAILISSGVMPMPVSTTAISTMSASSLPRMVMAPPFGVKLDRVGQEVEQDALQEHRIGHDFEILGHVELHGKAALERPAAARRGGRSSPARRRPPRRN